jgi:GH25 family lysozyme M1 (1,4-beta-N-acetylmuramidase)
MTVLWSLPSKPQCIDLFHGSNNADRDGPIDFAALRADGIDLVIHKASQGVDMVDPLYASRRQAALAAGLRWEAYHFCTSDPVNAQLAHFLAAATPDATMRLGIDIEPNRGATISPAQADAFAAALDSKRGLQTWRYSGMGFMTPGLIAVTTNLRNGPWWWAKYGPAPTPAQLASVGIDFAMLLMWQETATGARPGVTGQIDESYWVAGDLANYPALPGATAPIAPAAPTTVAAPTAAPADPVELQRQVQRLLAAAGNYRGPIDGDPGPQTEAAMSAYRRSHA